MSRRRFHSRPPNTDNRKALQLCRQVERTLSLSLEGDILRDLLVQSVVPAPDSTRLLVTFAFVGDDLTSSLEVLVALKHQQAKLRRAIAAAIHRKKTPDLAFQVVRC
jgi:ribosome-binding factor A